MTLLKKIKVKKYTSIIVLLLFVFAYFLNSNKKSSPVISSNEKSKTHLSKYGFELEEIGQNTGIVHIHPSYKVHPMIQNIGKWYSEVGAGVSAHDYNRDGKVDLFFCATSPGKRNYLYKNLGEGKFKDVTQEVNLDELNSENGLCLRPIFFDYNGDGLSDLFMSTTFCHRLYKQKPNGSFVNSTKEAGLEDMCFFSTASNILDYDMDGDLDLVISGYLPKLNLFNPQSTLIMPNSLTDANNGGPSYFLENKGDGTFENIFNKTKLKLQGWVLAIGIYDLNYDMYPDLWFAIDFNKSKVFINNKDGTFLEKSHELLDAFSHTGMGVDFEDVKHNREPFVYISQIMIPGHKVSGNQLFQYSSKGNLYNNSTKNNVDNCGWSWGVKFVDLNNNGEEDLVVTNGFISGKDKKEYWYYLSETVSAGPKFLENTKMWQPIGDLSLSGHEKNCLFYNNGSEFINISKENVFSKEAKDSRGLAKLDFNNNGSLDLIVTNQNDRPFLFNNKSDPLNRWIGFSIDGPSFNSFGYGTRFEIKLNNGQTFTKQAYSTNGFISQSDSRVHFGLGGKTIENITIFFPSGKVRSLDEFQYNSYNIVHYD